MRLRGLFSCHEPQHGAGSRSKPHAFRTTGSQDHHQKFGSRGVSRGEICQGTGLPHLSARSRAGSLFGERPGVWAVSERRFCVCFCWISWAFRNTTDVSGSPTTLIAFFFECEAFPLCHDLAALRCFECSEVPFSVVKSPLVQATRPRSVTGPTSSRPLPKAKSWSQRKGKKDCIGI